MMEPLPETELEQEQNLNSILCSPLLKMINTPLQKEINAALNLVLNNNWSGI